MLELRASSLSIYQARRDLYHSNGPGETLVRALANAIENAQVAIAILQRQKAIF